MRAVCHAFLTMVTALVYKGERVLTKQENKEYSSGKGGGNTYQFNVTMKGSGSSKKDELDKIATDVAYDEETSLLENARGDVEELIDDLLPTLLKK